MYLSWKKLTIDNFSNENINALYAGGHLFTRKHLGSMYQTRSLRIDLSKFELSSENRRILKKTENLKLETCNLPLENYTWRIGKMGKDFYETKFGLKTFSANKIKELLTARHNFNKLFLYQIENCKLKIENLQCGYAICRETNELLHYSYPFYNLQSEISNLGMGMMTLAIQHAKNVGKKYIYLGSAQRPTDTYKLQFTGLEWWDGKVWQTDLEELKQQIKQSKQ